MADEVTPAATPAAGGIFRSLLPERSVEDVLGGFLPLKLGDATFRLPVVVIERADEWRELMSTEFMSVVAALDGKTDAKGVLSFLNGQTPKMITLLRAYDDKGLLPDDEWIRNNASEPDVLRAFMLVLAASYPFVAAALDILAANPQALRLILEEFRAPSTADGAPTSTSPEPTAGVSNRSARRSRTSSSRAT